MNNLTLVVPNKNRINIEGKTTQLWLNSILQQSNNKFDVIVVDGGSKNYIQIKSMLNRYNIECIQHVLDDKFNKCILNNIGIKMARTPYIMTSDADMFYENGFFDKVMSILDKNVFIESRTMYWNNKLTERIHRGELDPIKNINSCKIGRIKRRTTCGGCQCSHIDNWNKIGGYDERYFGWGSEDIDLLLRMQIAKVNIVWLGETMEEIMLFHQYHDRPNLKEDLECQEKNKLLLRNIK